MELNYKSYGSGEPLIIAHGLFGMLDNWVSLAKKLATQYEVFLVDMRNHGKSGHSDIMNYPVMARDLYDFLEEQAIYHAYFLGHSMGGKTVLQFATLYPGFVRKMIIADIMPYAYQAGRTEHTLIFEAIREVNAIKPASRNEAEQIISNIIGDERISMFIFKNLKKNDKGYFDWKFNAEVLMDNYLSISGEIKFHNRISAPCLFLKAGNSDYIDFQRIKEYDKYITNPEMAVIPNASHWLHVDNTPAFIKVVLDFLME